MAKIVLTVFSILFAVAYGVVFSRTYPGVATTGGLVALFVVLGVATALIVFGVYRLIVWAVSHKKEQPPERP